MSLKTFFTALVTTFKELRSEFQQFGLGSENYGVHADVKFTAFLDEIESAEQVFDWIEWHKWGVLAEDLFHVVSLLPGEFAFNGTTVDTATAELSQFEAMIEDDVLMLNLTKPLAEFKWQVINNKFYLQRMCYADLSGKVRTWHSISERERIAQGLVTA